MEIAADAVVLFVLDGLEVLQRQEGDMKDARRVDEHDRLLGEPAFTCRHEHSAADREMRRVAGDVVEQALHLARQHAQATQETTA